MPPLPWPRHVVSLRLMNLSIALGDPDFLAGIVTASGVAVAPSPAELAARLDQLIARRGAEDFPPAATREGIRALLRRGGFKPSGRNKPASEYLAQAAREGRFPRINNLVDINNLLSMQTGLPISLLDLDALGPSIEIRYARAGETYIFNPAGQSIDLEGLICVCRSDPATAASTPMGNAIKDSMAGKLTDSTRNVIGVIYASRAAITAPALQDIVNDFAALLRQHGGAASAECSVKTTGG